MLPRQDSRALKFCVAHSQPLLLFSAHWSSCIDWQMLLTWGVPSLSAKSVSLTSSLRCCSAEIQKIEAWRANQGTGYGWHRDIGSRMKCTNKPFNILTWTISPGPSSLALLPTLSPATRPSPGCCGTWTRLHPSCSWGAPSSSTAAPSQGVRAPGSYQEKVKGCHN